MYVLIIAAAVIFCVFGGITLLSGLYSLNGIKAKTVGDGQHGTARWAGKREIKKTYRHIRFTPKQWRRQAESGKAPTGKDGKPLPQGIVVGCTGPRRRTTAMIETGDVHVLMIGAAGVGKTAYWLYPCLEYACATGMSFLSTDTKGDLVRNYGTIAEQCYGYHAGDDLRRIRAEFLLSGNLVKSHGKPNCPVRLRLQRKERSLPVTSDDRAAADDTG